MKQKRIKKNSQHLLNHFDQTGRRLTKPRKVILDVLHNTMEHLTVNDIHFLLHKDYPEIGVTTIYRTLDLFISWGLVHKFDFGEGKARYELIEDQAGEDHHHHLICTKCKKIIDYTDFIDEEVILLTKTEKALSKKHNFIIKNHIVEFYGICSDCQKNE